MILNNESILRETLMNIKNLKKKWKIEEREGKLKEIIITFAFLLRC